MLWRLKGASFKKPLTKFWKQRLGKRQHLLLRFKGHTWPATFPIWSPTRPEKWLPVKFTIITTAVTATPAPAGAEGTIFFRWRGKEEEAVGTTKKEAEESKEGTISAEGKATAPSFTLGWKACRLICFILFFYSFGEKNFHQRLIRNIFLVSKFFKSTKQTLR